MPFGLVDVVEVGFIGDRGDALLRWDDLVVAGHHYDGSELQAFGRCIVMIERRS